MYNYLSTSWLCYNAVMNTDSPSSAPQQTEEELREASRTTTNEKPQKSRGLAFFVIVVGVVFVAMMVAYTYFQVHNASIPASIGIDRARTLSIDNACLENNAAIKAEVQKIEKLGEDAGFWTSYIYDVPAGIQVDVNITTHDDTAVTGSLHYSDGYGSYNFTAAPTTVSRASAKGSPTATTPADEWHYTRFARCATT